MSIDPEPSGTVSADLARVVVASVMSEGDRFDATIEREAQRRFARAMDPAIFLPPNRTKKWILLDRDGRWTRYIGPMERKALRVAQIETGLGSAFVILGDLIITMWSREDKPWNPRRSRSPESIRRSSEKAKATWARKRAVQ